jgi:protein TonB
MKNKFKLLAILTILMVIMIFASCKNSNTKIPEFQPYAYIKVDTLPTFPQGDSAILKFIAENTIYPEDAKKENITGMVVVRFIVNEDCSISNVEVLRGVNPSLDAEAIRVVKTLPKFEKPGKLNGEPVNVYYMIPINFTLK